MFLLSLAQQSCCEISKTNRKQTKNTEELNKTPLSKSYHILFLEEGPIVALKSVHQAVQSLFVLILPEHPDPKASSLRCPLEQLPFPPS